MAQTSAPYSASRELIVSLCDYSHEVCVAATEPTYWEQLIHDSDISITAHGKYVPKELHAIRHDEEEPRLHLIIQSQYERDFTKLQDTHARIQYDLISFQHRDRPVYDFTQRQVTVFASLYNSLPDNLFQTERCLLGQKNGNIKNIRRHLGCSIVVDQPTPRRHRFIIQHPVHTIMNLAAIQIQALVRQAQDQYVVAYAMSIGRSLVGPLQPTEVMETSASSLNPLELPSYTSFQPATKRRREDADEEAINNGEIIADSDDSIDETTFDETRKEERMRMEVLLTVICQRMEERAPKDDVARAREDPSQIKTYFRNTNPSRSNAPHADVRMELVEHEIDLRIRKQNEHKCTLVFNDELKMGPGVRDRMKKTAKKLAYRQLIAMTRETPREDLILKKLKRGWKAVIRPTRSQ